jgi:hypothetical protein
MKMNVARNRTTRWRGCAPITLACALAVSLASVAGAADIPDADGDGVADAVDACPNTADGDFVGPDGCTICPCEQRLDGETWASHGEFLACVGAEARNVLSRRATRAALRRARNSTCGNDDLVRCCVFQNDDAMTGRCRVMTGDACDALDDSLFDDPNGASAWDFDSGSCLPNPCSW